MDTPKELSIRYTELSDEEHVRSWFDEPGVLQYFAMGDPPEVEDSVKRWMSYSKYRCSLTTLWDGVPCGIGTLWLTPYRKLAHQCQFGMIVAKDYRKKGVGTFLLNNICHLAKDYFNIELLHLEVNEFNPAIRLYKKFGFKEFGKQKKFIKDHGAYVGRLLMEREL